MTTKPLGPGPGAYELPTTVGYEKHDNRKERLPMYSFGLRTGLRDKNIGPGPKYLVDTLNRYGPKTNANHFTIAPRTFIKEKSIGPGPGAHEVHLKPFPKGARAPEFTLGARLDYAFKNSAPGPNAYTADVTPVKPRAPIYSVGLPCPIKSKQGSPGPAAHEYVKPDVTMPRSPEYTIAPRTEFRFKQYGPAFYNLMEYKPGKSGKAYSFGIRHSEYSPPMIVKCDNM